MGCPDEGCKERTQKTLSDHTRTLFGRDGMSGLVGCIKGFKADLKGYIPKSWLWKFVSTFLIFLIIGGYTLFAKVQAGEFHLEQNAQHIAKNAEAIDKLEDLSNKNEVRQVKIENKLDRIFDAIEDLKEEDDN